MQSQRVPSPVIKVFQLSGFNSKRKKELSDDIVLLGGKVLETENGRSKVTHIICGKPSRSEKFLAGLVTGKWILTVDYVLDSIKAKIWQDEAGYEWNSSKRDRAPNVENIDALLSSTSRWRRYVAAEGTGPFLMWRACVLVENEQKRNVYKRLLESGGAVLVDVKFPVKRPSLTARSVSHVFVEEAQIDKVTGLLNHGVLCLLPVYIGIFLITDPPPNARDHLVSHLQENVEQTRTFQTPNTFSQASVHTSTSAQKTRKVGVKNLPKKGYATKGKLLNQVLNKSQSSTLKSFSQSKDRTANHPNDTPAPQTSKSSSLINTPVADVSDLDETASLSGSSQLTESGSFSCTEPVLPPRKTAVGKPRLTLHIPGGSTAEENRFTAISDSEIKRETSDLAQPLPQTEELVTPQPGTSGAELNNNTPSKHASDLSLSQTHASPGSRVCSKCDIPHKLSLRKTRECNSAKKARSSPQPGVKASEGTKRSKRKLDMPNLIAKRRKLDLPWPRACPDISHPDAVCMRDKVVLQVSKTMTDMFEATLEENHINQSLYLIQSSVSTLRYPQPKALHAVIKVLLNTDCKVKARKTYYVLRRILSLHPPSSAALQELYLVAIRGAMDEDQPVGGLAWQVIKNSLGILLDKDKSVQHLNHWLFLKFVVAVVESNTAAIMSRFDPKAKLTIASSIWGQILYSIGRVGQFNASVGHLLKVFLDVLKGEPNPEMDLTGMMQSLLAITATCCHQGPPVIKEVSADGITLAREFAYLIKGHVNENPDYLQRVLAAIEVPWLRLHVTLTWLDELYDDSLLPPEGVEDTQLNLRKIVSHYFFLLPPLLPHVPPSPHTKCNASSPFKAYPTTPLSDVNHTKVRSSSAQSSPDKSEAALKRKMMNINKKNVKGETALHRACIKNEVVRVKELLQIQGIDVNAVDNAGWTPLHEASNRGSVDCLVELLKYRPPKTITSFFSPASTSGKSNRLNLMPVAENGITPLHDAVQNDQVEVARTLLQHGGRKLLEAKTNDGKTPLDLSYSDVMTEVLNSAEQIIPSSPCVTPRKRKSYFSIADDSVLSSQGSQGAMDNVALTVAPPPEESYSSFLTVPATSLASPTDCLNLVILLFHLIQSYMVLHDTLIMKQHVLNSSPRCPFSEGDECLKGKTHVKCLARKLGKKLGLTEEHLMGDLSMLRYWRDHIDMLKGHLERISDGKTNTDTKVINQLYKTEILGCLV